MCVFTGPVRVEGTRIFARVDRHGSQGLVYEMQYESAEPVAMVLPLPVAADDSGRPLRFIDLSEYRTFFRNLEELFEPTSAGIRVQSAGKGATLAVERVGSYEASFVPSLAEFSRLDARFRLDDRVWRSLPRYSSYGFAVFQLAAGGAKVHPMALAFRTLDPTRTFFPTVHIHDGTVPKVARFDHVLYAQTAARPEGWELSRGPANLHVNVERARRLVRGSQPLLRRRMSGLSDNVDTWA